MLTKTVKVKVKGEEFESEKVEGSFDKGRGVRCIDVTRMDGIVELDWGKTRQCILALLYGVCNVYCKNVVVPGNHSLSRWRALCKVIGPLHKAG